MYIIFISFKDIRENQSNQKASSRKMNASKHHKSSKEILGHVRPARQFEALQYVYDMCKPLTCLQK